MFGRKRFDDLVTRQLDLFETDEAALIAEAEKADATWTNASRGETEEFYGDYQLVVDALGERLHDIRETYASSLDERTGAEYRAAFSKAALKRFRRYATLLHEEN